MKLKKYFPNGKAFYSILLLLIVFINVPILVALLLTQQTLEHSHQNLQSTLVAVQSTQMEYIQDANPGRNHISQLAELREHPLLEKLGGMDSLEYGTELKDAEKILDGVTPSGSQYGQITTYLYFQKSGYLIDSSRPGVNALKSADPRIFNGFDGLDMGSVPRAYFHGASEEDRDDYTIYTAMVFPDVVFIFDIYFSEYPVKDRPDMFLSEEFTSGLKDVEMGYYDSYGNVRATRGDGELLREYDYFTLGPDENTSFPFKHDGHYYLCYYVYNEHTMTKFALICRDEIAEDQHRMSVLVWVSGSVMLIAFLACAYFTALRAYRPIGSLVSRLDTGGDDNGVLKDEFQVLNDAISSFDDRINKRDRLLSKYYLLRVLRGQKVDAFEGYHDEWLEDADGYSFAVAALRVDEFEDGGVYDEAKLEGAVSAFFKSEGSDIRTVSDSDFLYIVFRLPEGAQGGELLEKFRRLQEQTGDFCFSVYVSDIHSSTRELKRCYNEARVVSEYYIANEKINMIADSASTPRASLSGTSASPDFRLLNKLSDCISTLSTDDALAVFDEIAAALSQAGATESAMYNLLVNTIALALYDTDVSGDAGKAAVAQCVGQIRSASGAWQLRAQLQGCLQTLAKRGDGQEYNQQRFEKIRAYINKNYSDPNLDSASIAEHYKMSPSTITRLFKKYNGTGFLEYVHQTRVDKAIELLQTTELSVSEVSAMVGYTNAATMNRAFKTHANSTPSMIRKRLQ